MGAQRSVSRLPSALDTVARHASTSARGSASSSAVRSAASSSPRLLLPPCRCAFTTSAAPRLAATRSALARRKPGTSIVEEDEEPQDVEAARRRGDDASSSSAGSSSSSSAADGSGASDGGDGSDASSAAPPSSPPPSPGSSIAKQVVPDNYPQVLALPMARRPLFPGFYKAVTIRNPRVIAAIKEMVKRGQGYIGVFLTKDDASEADVITDPDSVYPVGVFAQVTANFGEPASANAGGSGEGASGEGAGQPMSQGAGFTAVIYPHRRIRIKNFLPLKEPGSDKPSAAVTKSDASLTDDAAATASTEQDPNAPNFQTSFLHDYGVSIVNVENVTTESYDKKSATVHAIVSEIIAVMKDVATLSPLFRDQVANFSVSTSAGTVFDDPDKLADFAAACSSGESSEMQDVLAETSIEERLHKALLVIKKELMNIQLQNKISRDVEGRIQKKQREYFLSEQLKGIQKELGIDGNGKDKVVSALKERAATLNMPEPVRKVFDEEIARLAHIEPHASEFGVARAYLDWITQIPWGKHTRENFELPHAVTVLDEDHYGLQDVKDRILEFLAVGKLRGTVQGKILCLVGPPGVGKTSIGKSIARALDRQFYRFSVGGLHDVAEIKGHRRTYVGAMPGKPLQALKKVQAENPLILIDEIDKLGRAHNGDPASALLELLDPEQNVSFTDHYLDIPVDMSRVLFVCTANSTHTIPAPLLDRMEVIEVSGYIADEKVAIAERHLIPQAKDMSGLLKADVTIAPDALDRLIRYYCQESGVRRLKQQIEKVYRKAALKIVQDLGEELLPEPEPAVEGAAVATDAPAAPQADGAAAEAEVRTDSVDKVTGNAKPGANAERTTTTEVRKPIDVPESVHVLITADNLFDYLGPAPFSKDRIYTRATPAGVSNGLGFTGDGAGSLMPIEATTMPGSGGTLTLTGKLGEVIRESAQIGLSFCKTHAHELGLVDDQKTDLLDKRSVHLHMPEGAVGKEGPSAGTAILTALISLFSKTPVAADLAMTGEVTLGGKVLPVGGLKEKLLAARRAGISTVIVPAANEPVIAYKVPATVKEGLNIVYADDVRDVMRVAFAGQPIAERFETLPALTFGMAPMPEPASSSIPTPSSSGSTPPPSSPPASGDRPSLSALKRSS